MMSRDGTPVLMDFGSIAPAQRLVRDSLTTNIAIDALTEISINIVAVLVA